MAELQKINHRHEAIILWLISNPDKTLGDCAREFNYTQSWLTQIIHSDMFQALYRQKCQELGALVVHDLRSKMTGLAVAVVEHSRVLIESGTASQDFVLETAKNVLDRLGYAPPARGAGAQPSQTTQINISVTAEELTAARARAQAKRFSVPSEHVIEEVFDLPQPTTSAALPVAQAGD